MHESAASQLEPAPPGSLPALATVAAALVGAPPARALADARRLLSEAGVGIALYRRDGEAFAPLDGAPTLAPDVASLLLAGSVLPGVLPLVEDGHLLGALVLDSRLAPEDEDTLAAVFTLGVVRLLRRQGQRTAGGPPSDFLERVFDALPTAVLVSEPQTHRILSANPAYLELVGLSEAEVVGQAPPYPWWAEPPQVPVRLWLVDPAGEHWSQIFRHADGRPVPVEGRSFLLRDANGDPEREIALVTDQSQRRQFEKQLVQSGKMAAIGELASGVAHEINNPLFAILGLVEFLLKDAEPGTKGHERLLLVQQTGLEIKEIVRALLDFARERSDDFRLLDLNEIVGQTLELVRRATSAKGVELVVEASPEPILVTASAGQLKQILLNLITNAQQVLPDGGTVTIALHREGDWAHLTVTDDGPGIPPEMLGRIFDPFFTTKRELGGTGLGLSVSIGIAQMHGGELSASSALGEGASFALRLPLAPEAEA